MSNLDIKEAKVLLLMVSAVTSYWRIVSPGSIAYRN